MALGGLMALELAGSAGWRKGRPAASERALIWRRSERVACREKHTGPQVKSKAHSFGGLLARVRRRLWPVRLMR